MKTFTSWPYFAPRFTKIHNKDLQYCMTSARLLAQMSRATRARVGCVIFHAGRRTIVGIGYNGTEPGTDNTMEQNNVTLPTVIHAEDNALRKLTRWDKHSADLVLVVTHAPCLSCAQKIVRSGVQRVFYAEDYGDPAGIAWLQKHKVAVRRVYL